MKKIKVLMVLGWILFLSGPTFAANIIVAGALSPFTGVNGTYVQQSGTVNGFAYWKHQTSSYYIFNYYNYWTIDDDTDAEDDSYEVIFADDGDGTAATPIDVTAWVYGLKTGNSGAAPISVSAVSVNPEINLKGNNTNIASGDNSPSFLDHTKFGSALPNSGTSTREFTIQNTGSAALTVGTISFSGTNATEYTVTSSPTSPVAASGSTTFTVTFAPTGTGDRNATISIVNSDSDENPYTFSLNGYGYTVKALVVSGITTPAAANGNYISQGILNNFQYWKHATENYYIFNFISGGSPDWAIDNDQVGTNGSLFYYVSEAVSPNGLTPWQVQFGVGTPVVSEATPTPEINVKGNNSQNLASGDNSPSRYDGTNFGSLDYSSGSRTRTYTIQNTGTAALTLSGSSPYISLSGATSDFSVSTAPSNSIAASGSTTFIVTFDPASEGTKTAIVTINNNDSDEGTYTFTIQGDGYTPKNVVLSGVTSPSALNGTYTHLGLINEYQYWKFGSYYIYNSDNGGTVDGNWYIDNDTDRSAYYFRSLNNGENGFPVNVTSWTASLGTGTPVIQYAAPEINITGNSETIIDGDATASEFDHTDFGYTGITAGTIVRTFTIKNTGTETLTLTGTSPYVVVGGADASYFAVTTVPSASIAANGSTTFNVTFDPDALREFNATLSIANNDASENPYNFSIKGTGSASPTVTTQAVSSIGTTTTTGNANVTATGGANITERGIYWSTTNGFADGTGTKVSTTGNWSTTGTFTQEITGLSSGTTYYVKAFATNAAGTSYGTEVSFRTLTPGTFTGNTSSDWGTAGNWAGGSVPTSAINVTIPSVLTNYPVIGPSLTADCNNITIASGASLTIQSSSSGTGSLIIKGTSTGSATTQCYLTADHWSIISPSASGQSVESFLSTNTGIPTKTTNRGMMDYNTLTNTWNAFYPTTGATGTMDAGKGYMARVNPAGVLTFSGNLTSETKTVSLVTTGERWNCIGNPFTSAINAKTSTAPAENFITKNNSSLDPSYACLYLWDYTSLSYKIIGSLPAGLGGERALSQDYLQSGQGFFVKAASGATTVTFTTAMQIHQPAATFKSAETWPNIELVARSGDIASTTLLAFDSKMSRGLDPGFDAGLMRGSSGIELFTRLVEDNGVDFAIQCLPLAGIENTIIPIGFDCKTSGEVVFTAKSLNLPIGLTAILEDRLLNSKTLLDSPSDQHKTTVQANSTGTGRFYLHLKSGTTGIDPILVGKNINAWVERDEIVISGVETSNASAMLYDVAGRTIIVNNLQPSPANRLNASHLKPGIYILKVLQSGRNYGFKIHIN